MPHARAGRGRPAGDRQLKFILLASAVVLVVLAAAAGLYIHAHRYVPPQARNDAPYQAPQPAPDDLSWHAYGGDPGQTRHSAIRQIDRSNVAHLRQAWVYRTGEIARRGRWAKDGKFQNTPIIAAGMARYGHVDEALRITAAMYEASLCFDQHRLPELFCGFSRREGEGPTLYPVACSPQAWAAATVFGLLGACLGIGFRADPPAVVLRRPRLPDYIQWLRIGPLSIRHGSVEMLLRRYENNVGIDVLHKHGDVEVSVVV